MPLTPEQKQQMQVQVAMLKAQIDALVVDAGGPVVVPPVGSSGLWSRHNSAYLGARKYWPVSVDANGKPGNPPVDAGPFYSLAVWPPEGRVQWGKDIEHHQIIDGLGLKWGGILGFEDTSLPGTFWPVEPVSVDWINLDINKSIDLTGVRVTGKFGHVMCPEVLPPNGNYRLRAWFWVWSGLAGSRQHPAFWQCDYHFGKTVTNLAWVGDGPQSRPAIVYEEAWWDEPGGWTGGGTSPGKPWVGGAPLVVSVSYDGHSAFGQDAGSLWAYQHPAYKVALGHVTNV